MGPSNDETGISVIGTGRVTVEPEIATLEIGVSLSGPSLDQLRADAGSKVGAARDHLLSAGVAAADIRTSRLDVHTSFDHTVRRQTHHVSTGLATTIRDLTIAESLVNELFSAVGDGMDMRGLTFGVEDRATGRDEALERAFADAKAKAVHLAALAGVGLGPVLAITEGATTSHQPMPMLRNAMASSAADIPIEAGELDQVAMVSVRWAIDN